MVSDILPWVLFNLFVLILLALDLGVFHKQAHEISIKEALVWSAIWIVLALIFNAGVYFIMGQKAGLEFFTGYLLERALSIDNIFVFIVVLSYFKVEPRYQHKVLFWGILGALIMRALFIAAGITLIQQFHWIIYVFGAFLVFTGIRLAIHDEEDIHPERNPVLKLARRLLPVTSSYHEGKFIVRVNGKLLATPMLIVLIVIETTDVVFAMDSIPAILAITLDPFIVYTSNVFAILGLRALYFALAGTMKIFRFLNIGLAIILVFIGVKMLLADIYPMSITLALGVVAGILALSIVVSVVWPGEHRRGDTR
jgi:tellurite resistance protein TerC